MNYILMDIKKFLKKLETGQMEIEAGQWELHKDITNLKNAIQGLKQLKTDLELMKQCGLKQTDLIKELQTKLSMLEDVDDNDPWSSTESSSHDSRSKSPRDEQIPKERRRLKTHSKIILRSGKTKGISSQHSLHKRESVIGFRPRSEREIIMRERGYGRSSPPFRKLKSESVTKKSPQTPPPDHSILQRYLQDTARYVDRETSRMSYISSKKSRSGRNRQSGTEELDFCKNRDSPKSMSDPSQNKQKVSDRCRKKSANQEKFICPAKFSIKDNFLKYKRKQAKPLYACEICDKYFVCKSRLKRHGKVHQKMSKSFRGFRCSYCDKVCRSPENLTAHLKTCRIIKKTHRRDK